MADSRYAAQSRPEGLLRMLRTMTRLSPGPAGPTRRRGRGTL